jgi:hypothetical protein
MIETHIANRVWLLGRLKHSLQLLASQADVQLRELPDCCLKSDELFLSFNNWRMALVANFQSETTTHQLSCLDAILQKFGPMGHESWTDSALSNSSEWKQIRQLASAAVEAFGWSH